MSFTLTEFMLVVSMITDTMNNITNNADTIILISSTTPQITLLDIPVIIMIYLEIKELVNGLRD